GSVEVGGDAFQERFVGGQRAAGNQPSADVVQHEADGLDDPLALPAREQRSGGGRAQEPFGRGDGAMRGGGGATPATVPTGGGRLNRARGRDACVRGGGLLCLRAMRALVCDVSVPRQVVSALLGRLDKRFFLGPFSPATLRDVPDPSFPADDWLVLRTRLCGICGSDAKQIFLNGRMANPMTALISFPHL